MRSWTIHAHDDHEVGRSLVQGPDVDARAQPVEVVSLSEVRELLDKAYHPQVNPTSPVPHPVDLLDAWLPTRTEA